MVQPNTLPGVDQGESTRLPCNAGLLLAVQEPFTAERAESAEPFCFFLKVLSVLGVSLRWKALGQ